MDNRDIETAEIDKTEEMGRLLYEQVCTHLNIDFGYLVYFQGIRALTIKKDKEVSDYKMHESTYSKDVIISLLGSKAQYNLFLAYICKEHSFKGRPKLTKRASITQEGRATSKGFDWLNGVDADTWRDIAFKDRININHKNGEVRIQLGFQPVQDTNNIAIEELLEIIVPDQYEREAFKQFASLYAFEDRGGLSKPTFIMFGARGSGKNLIGEYFLGEIYPGQVRQLPPNADSFTGFLERKGVIMDENAETASNQSAQYEWIKKHSGSKLTPINKKGVEVEDVVSQSFFFIFANDKPIQIKDEIKVRPIITL
jgi:hypothetical protein